LIKRNFYQKVSKEGVRKNLKEPFTKKVHQKFGGIRINLKLKGAKPPAVW